MVAVRRIPLFALGAVALLVGMSAGTARLGWEMPFAPLAAVHGPLMICAFFGTVIGLERAVALDRRWGFAAPLLAGLGGVALLAELPLPAAALAFALSSLVFTAMAADVVRRQPALFTVIMALGGACWLAGNLLWLAGGPVTAVTALWACFPVLTIAGERLELSRFLPPSPDRAATAPVPLAVLIVAAALQAAEVAWSGHLFGAGLLLLAAWLGRHDIARRTIRQTGLTRYMAVCLLSGYVWLAAAGLMALAGGLPPWGYLHDAVLHALFVGFVFAMVFGHAPVILPAVLRVVVPFTRWFYLPLALLHLSVAARVAGDLLEVEPLRQHGGLCNAAAIVLFLLTTATLTIRATRARSAVRKVPA